MHIAIYIHIYIYIHVDIKRVLANIIHCVVINRNISSFGFGRRPLLKKGVVGDKTQKTFTASPFSCESTPSRLPYS